MSTNSMGLSIFQWLHYVSLMMLFLGFGGLILGALIAQSREFPYRRGFVLLHGVGLLFLFVSGFAQLGLLKLSPMPTWVVLKIFIWLALGLLLSVILRKPYLNKWMWIMVVGLGSLASYLAVFKPAF